MIRDATHANTLGSCYTSYLFLAVFFVFFPVTAEAVNKTPNDVYAQALLLKDKVELLRKENEVRDSWPPVYPQQGKAPRHVLQKALEILGKVNRYRVIEGMGEVSVPRFPGREITPSEVYDTVVRLVDELDLLLEPGGAGSHRQLSFVVGKSPSDVYEVLWEVSHALDPALGIRGFNPSDVYARSRHVLDLVEFLRRSQNLPMDVPKPERTTDRYPNHALTAVYSLHKGISIAEKNLWMEPINVPETPQRVITPTDVFDALGIVLAELQRIKYRLGLERNFATPPLKSGKTPDDVIQNLEWTLRMLPDFSPGTPVVQFSRSELAKTPSHVFAVTEYTRKRLERYRRVRGIQALERIPTVVQGLKPRHVYQKCLESLEKTESLRRRIGLGPTAVPRYPLRDITPAEVYDLAIRLDEDLAILFRHAGMEYKVYSTALDARAFSNKTPSDAYRNMWQISLMLDTVLGSEGFTPGDVYPQAQMVLAETRLIAGKLGYTPEMATPDLRPGTEPGDVLNLSRELLKQVQQAQRRTGMEDIGLLSVPVAGNITPSDVSNQVRLILAELVALKLFLGITEVVGRPSSLELADKVPADVYQVLDQTRTILKDLLHMDAAG